MKIALGCDHVAYKMKLLLKEHLEQLGHTCVDFGCHDETRCDYPVYGEKAARAVASGECDRGILLCGTGAGISLAANRVKGIRCVNCSEPYTARMARAHNDANMISMGARVIGIEMAKMILDEYLNTEFEGGRHQTRLDMLEAIDRD